MTGLVERTVFLISSYSPNTRFSQQSVITRKIALLFYIEARYSDHYEITVEELNYLQGEVEKLKGLVEKVCRGRFAEDERES